MGRIRMPYEHKHVYEDTSKMVDVCVPDQALSIPELLERYRRECKPLPRPVDYDIESVEKEYHDLQVPEHLSREDALHLMDLTKAHMAKLDYSLRKSSAESPSEVPSEGGPAQPQGVPPEEK